MSKTTRISSLLAVLLLGACVTVPTGPGVLVLPGTGKNFDQFRADDAVCRQFARDQVGGVTADQASTQSAVQSAAVGTALGAAAGAAFNGGQGAAVGAGAGLLVGALAGTGASQNSAYLNQQRYDYGYQQCMYAKGHRVPVYGHYAAQPSPAAYPPPPPPPPPPR
jgi:YmgG-like glycine-zipper protein